MVMGSAWKAVRMASSRMEFDSPALCQLRNSLMVSFGREPALSQARWQGGSTPSVMTKRGGSLNANTEGVYK